jgi:DNA (cytosine-5)-methyltransferase 1
MPEAFPEPPSRSRPLPVISLFSGGFGLDLGLDQAGFDVRVAIEANKWAAATIEANRASGAIRSEVEVVHERIENLSTADILSLSGLKPGDPMVVSAGPSCQSFSTAGRRRSLDDPRGTLFREFLRVVTEAQPRFFVMEQVRGVLSAAVRHRPLALRGPGHPPLTPDEQHGSALRLILRELADSGYYTVFNMINVADYGVGQVRHRVLFIGSRDGEDVRIPLATHADDPADGVEPWLTLREVLNGVNDPEPAHLPLSARKAGILEQIPAGGNWRSLPPDGQREALGKAFVSWGGRSGFFRRLAWDRPAPALTTRPDSTATLFGHPSEVRTLSVREYSALQGFPDGYEFAGPTGAQFKQIGNAVPPPIGQAVASQLLALIQRRKRPRPERKGRVACESASLLAKFEARPRTVMDPPRMRAVKDLSAARAWMATTGGSARAPLDVDLLPPRRAA